MSIEIQQSSILTEMELQLLAAQSTNPENYNFTVYAYQLSFQLDNCFLYQADNLEQLLLMLTASSHGSALVLPDSIESQPLIHKLLAFLKNRADIHIFWVGQMPSMELELPEFEYCFYLAQLLDKLSYWQQQVEYIYSRWLHHYPVAFITDHSEHYQQLLTQIGLHEISYLDGSVSAMKISNQQLLIIDLTTAQLDLVPLLDELVALKKFPILILLGELPENLCQTASNLSQSKGFSILTWLSFSPDNSQWQRLLHSLYAKIYLKHWITPTTTKLAAPIYNIDQQQLSSYFCLDGISKKQIAALHNKPDIGKIISVNSLVAWLAKGNPSVTYPHLAEQLHCQSEQLGIYIDQPEKINTNSKRYAALLTAGLVGLHIYWLIDNENQLSNDTLKNFPISDIIFSEFISNHLLGEPDQELLDFINQAKLQKISLTATLEQTPAVNDAMSLYGIECICNTEQ